MYSRPIRRGCRAAALLAVPLTACVFRPVTPSPAPTPEHLDLRAIRQISTDATQSIVDPASAEVLRGLVEVFTLPSGIPIRAGQVRLEALAAYAAELLPEQIDLGRGNSYLAEFGSLRLLIASRGHLLPALRPHNPVDVALLVLNEATALGYSGG